MLLKNQTLTNSCIPNIFATKKQQNAVFSELTSSSKDEQYTQVHAQQISDLNSNI